jgi:iron(III) transport system permease protein
MVAPETQSTLPPPSPVVRDGARLSGRGRRRSRLARTVPWFHPFLTPLSAVVTIAVLLPIVFLLWQASQAGWSTVWPLIWRGLTWTLLVNTVQLAVIVTCCTAVIACTAAWLIERTTLPGRRFWRAVVVLPLAIPDFVIGYTWSSFAPAVHGLFGASLVMTLGLYPLVYLPVAAALRRADSSLYEVARSLGHGRFRALLRTMLPQVWAALLGGCLMVMLGLLAEYGAFEILRFQTFTTEIFTEFNLGMNTAAASALSVVLVVLSLLAVGGEMAATRRVSSRAGRPSGGVRRYRLGWSVVPSAGFLLVLVGLGVGVPLVTLVYWLTQPVQTLGLTPVSLLGAAGYTLWYSAVAAVLATVAALPVAFLAVRYPSRLSRVLERLGYLVQGLPGLVIALSLVFFATRLVFRLYESATLLIIAYAIMFFPMALISLRASLVQLPRRLSDTARSLGCSPLMAFIRVTVPLAAPGIAASVALVFLSAVTELTATLVLVPTGVQTLATAFWGYESDVSYALASRYAAVIVLLAIIPGWGLSRWLDPSRSSERGRGLGRFRSVLRSVVLRNVPFGGPPWRS